jgi:glycosyltransferase involved in cell wall biosynthesis
LRIEDWELRIENVRCLSSSILNPQSSIQPLKVAVIMPVERVGGDAERAISSVLSQEVPFPFELIVVSAAPLNLPAETRVRNVVEPDRNPATRRNRAVSETAAEILAFIDDDAIADPQWLMNAVGYLDEHPDVLAVGGPDPAPPGSPIPELISDTLLATRWIGSGVAAHENRRGIFPIARASDIALVNLIVRRSAFTGFDESIGYIGEDTKLIEELMKRGQVMYHQDVRVYHRRRAFPGPYLRQRWRYRVKTGRMIASGERARDPRVDTFLVAGFLAILLAPLVAVPYAIITLILGAKVTRLPLRWWPAIPVAFAMHHLTYWLGLVTGIAIAARPRA